MARAARSPKASKSGASTASLPFSAPTGDESPRDGRLSAEPLIGYLGEVTCLAGPHSPGPDPKNCGWTWRL